MSSIGEKAFGIGNAEGRTLNAGAMHEAWGRMVKGSQPLFAFRHLTLCDLCSEVTNNDLSSVLCILPSVIRTSKRQKTNNARRALLLDRGEKHVKI